jgi:hypothetical protein
MTSYSTQSDQEFSWGAIDRMRAECFQRYGPVLDLEICKGAIPEALALLEPRSTVLDVGAGYRKHFSQFLESPGHHYSSLDVDVGEHDFRSASDIPTEQTFDLIFANQLLEHLSLDAGSKLLRDLRPHLRSGSARFVASVPNAAHPVRHGSDPTHVTAYGLNDLYSVFRMAGYEVCDLMRYGKKELPRNPLRRWVTKVVADVYRVDWMDSLVIVARNPE